jgi:transposase InsO family protein
MLVDTGASITLVHCKLLKPSSNLKPTHCKVTGVTGSPLRIMGEAMLDLNINGLVTNHRCVIVETMEHDAIIGYDLLKGEGYTLDFSNPVRARKGKRQTACLRLPSELHIPAQSRKFVHITPSRRLDWCLEARVEPLAIPLPGVWVEDAVSTIEEEGKVMISIVNTTACGLTLQRRTLVAHVFSFQGERVNHIRVSDWLTECLESPFSDKVCSSLEGETGVKVQKRAEGPDEAHRAKAILAKMELSTLNQNQLRIVQRLVQQHSRSFALEGEPLTATPLTQYRVPTGNAAPVRKRAYRLPECHREPLRKLIQTLQDEGVITRSNSEWSAPILLIPKGTSGTYRLVSDYRGLNKLLTKDAYPLPRVDDLLDNLKDASCFTVLDMKSSFYQIKVAPEDRHKTAFVCMEGLFEYLRMSMGMSNSTSCMQRMLETLFADMKSTVAIFIDDIIIFSKNEAQHEQAVEKVLGRLGWAQLTLKPEKCQFFKSQVEYLGHLVTDKGIYPLNRNIQKVVNYPVPQNLTQLRSFVGLASFYRKFVKDFANIAKPLTEMTKKGKVWSWGAVEQEAFQKLKTELVNPPILCYPRYELPFVLQTDASDKAIGAVLGQEQEGLLRVVAYGSRSLTSAEQNYSTIEKEALSIVHFVGEYRHYLLGRKFLIETDHAPLSFLNKQSEPKGRLGRWAIQLSEFDYELKYKPGRENGNADCLSRLPVAAIAVADEEKEEVSECISVGKIKRVQQKDEWCKSMIGYLRRGELPSAEALRRKVVWESSRYLIRGDGVLAYLPSYKVYSAPEMGAYPVIVLPQPLRETVLYLLHNALTAGHLGFQKTLKKVQERFYWPHMYSDVEKHTQSCDSCARVKTPAIKRKAPLAVFTTTTRPLEAIQMDFIGPVTPKANDGSQSILVVTDLFTRYAEAYPLENQTAPLVAKTLVTQFFCRYGTPTKIHSDRAPNFMSTLIKEVMKLYEVHHVKGSSYRPMSQGSVERMNRSLIEMLKHFTSQNVLEWSEYVPYVISAYNDSVNASTLYTPYELFYGRKMQLPLDVLINKPTPKYKEVDNYHQEVAERLHISHQLARKNSAEARKTQAKYYNYRAKKREFRCGDRVYVTNEAKNAKRKKGTDEKGNVDCRKFRMAWIGPCTIVERKGEVVYVIKHDSSGKLETVHQDRLKLTYESKIARKARAKKLNKEKAGIPQEIRPLRSHTQKKQAKDVEARWWEDKTSDSDSDGSSEENQPQELEEDSDSSGEADLDSEESEEEDEEGRDAEESEEEGKGMEEGPIDEGRGGELKEIINPKEPGIATNLGRDYQPPELERYENIMAPTVVKRGEDIPQIPLSPTLPILSPHKETEKTITPAVPSPNEKQKSPDSKAIPRMRKDAPEFQPEGEWWGKLKPPNKKVRSSPADPLETRELTEEKKEELRRLFDKVWKQKVRHEASYKSEYTMNLGKIGKTEEEKKFAGQLLQQATSTYQRSTQQSYPNTRKKQQNEPTEETALYARLGETKFLRGVVVKGRYLSTERKYIPYNHDNIYKGKINRIQG